LKLRFDLGLGTDVWPYYFELQTSNFELQTAFENEVQRYGFGRWGKVEVYTFHSSRMKTVFFAKMAEW